MDIFDYIAACLVTLGCFAALVAIVRTAALSIRAFVQGINEADDPRHGRDDATRADTPPVMRIPRIDKRWVIPYVACVLFLFWSMTRKSWSLSHQPELFISLIVSLFVLRFFAYFLPRGRRPRRSAAATTRYPVRRDKQATCCPRRPLPVYPSQRAWKG